MLESLSTFHVVCFSFQKAEVASREAYSLGDERQKIVIEKLISLGAENVMVLSTCNRTEFYWSDVTPKKAMAEVYAELGMGVPRQEPFEFKGTGMAAVRHLFRVGCALESQIPGDTEIAGQLKLALRRARDCGSEVALLDRVVSMVLKASKRVKAETGLSTGATSVAFSGIHFMRNELRRLKGAKVVLLGLGKLGRNTCKNLAKHASGADITVINRDESKAKVAASEHGFQARPFGELKGAVREARVLIVATGAQHFTVTKDMVSEGQKLLILDMSMPRNADPSLGKLEGVTLLDVDEISQYALNQLQERFVHMPKAEQIVNEELVEFEVWLESLKVAPLLGSVKQGLQEFRDVELDKLKTESLRGEDQIKQLSDRLIQKVTTQVATYLKTKSDCIEDDLHLFQQVFNVKDS